jgi:hypothetical protein
MLLKKAWQNGEVTFGNLATSSTLLELVLRSFSKRALKESTNSFKQRNVQSIILANGRRRPR